jgi:hypothetical protein
MAPRSGRRRRRPALQHPRGGTLRPAPLRAERSSLEAHAATTRLSAVYRRARRHPSNQPRSWHDRDIAQSAVSAGRARVVARCPNSAELAASRQRMTDGQRAMTAEPRAPTAEPPNKTASNGATNTPHPRANHPTPDTALNRTARRTSRRPTAHSPRRLAATDRAGVQVHREHELGQRRPRVLVELVAQKGADQRCRRRRCVPGR